MDIENQTPETAPVAEVNPEPTTEEVVVPQEQQQPIVNQEQAPSEPELYELPDGRKVDGETLAKEWKENFYPEYTRKSQELSKLKSEPKEPQQDDIDENWTPQTYADIVKLAEERAITRIKSEQEQEKQYRQQVEDTVKSEIEEIKKADPSANENAIFAHANKWGFSSLKQAYENMREIKKVAETTEQRVVKTIQARQAEPVSTGKPNTSPTDNAIDFNNIYNETPMEMLKRLNS